MDWLNFFKIAGYAALIFGSVCTIGVNILKDKSDNAEKNKKKEQMDTLSADVKASRMMLEPFSNLAKKMYPDLDQRGALEKLKERMDTADRQIESGKIKMNSLHSQLDAEHKTIKTFSAIVSIEFTGQWSKPPYSVWSEPPNGDTLLKWMNVSDNLPEIAFSTSKVFWETIDDHTGRMKNTVVVQPSTFPLGEIWDVLNLYEEASVKLYFSWPEHFTGSTLTITRIDIDLYINGAKKGGLHESGPWNMNLSQGLAALVPGKAMNLSQWLSLKEKPVKGFKLSL